MIAESVVTIGLAYLVGMFPTAYLLGRYVKGIDLRGVGSQNPGALNAYRRLGLASGVLVLAGDAGKGALAIFIGQRLNAPDIPLYLAAVAATLGHNFPPILGFKGGKGAATVLGISAIMLWQITTVALAAGVVLFAITRHAVWTLTGIFVLLNVLTISTSQPVGQIAVCLALSFIVVGTHVMRQRPEILPAIRGRRWRELMRIE